MVLYFIIVGLLSAGIISETNANRVSTRYSRVSRARASGGPVVRSASGRRATATSDNPRWTGAVSSQRSAVSASSRGGASRPSTRGGTASGLGASVGRTGMQNSVVSRSVGGLSERQSQYSSVEVSQGMNEYADMVTNGGGAMSVKSNQSRAASSVGSQGTSPSGVSRDGASGGFQGFSLPTSTTGQSGVRQAATTFKWSDSLGGRSKVSSRTAGASSRGQQSSAGRSMFSASVVSGKSGSRTASAPSRGQQPSAGRSMFNASVASGKSGGRSMPSQGGRSMPSQTSPAPSQDGEIMSFGQQMQDQIERNGSESYLRRSQFPGHSDHSAASGYDTASEFGMQSVGGRSNVQSQRSGGSPPSYVSQGQPQPASSSVGGRSNAPSQRTAAQSYTDSEFSMASGYDTASDFGMSVSQAGAMSARSQRSGGSSSYVSQRQPGGSSVGMRSAAPSQRTATQSYTTDSEFSMASGYDTASGFGMQSVAGQSNTNSSQRSGAQSSYATQSQFGNSGSASMQDDRRSAFSTGEFFSEGGEAFDAPPAQRDPSLQMAMRMPSTDQQLSFVDADQVAFQILNDEQQAKFDAGEGLGSLPRPPADLVLPPGPPSGGDGKPKKKGLFGKIFGR